MAATKLEIDIQIEGDVSVVQISGPIDSTTIDQFKDTLDKVFKADTPKVLLDCSKLTYINSRAIGMLTAYHRTCYANAGKMAMCDINSKIVRTLDLLQIGKVLKRYRNREEALAGLRE